ncbi:MAG: hypothetical protein ACT4OY_06655 [Alphaproteobacteria bacterium]
MLKNKIYGVLDAVQTGKELGFKGPKFSDFKVWHIKPSEEFNYLSSYHEQGLTNEKSRIIKINNHDSKITVFKTIAEGDVLWEGPIKTNQTLAYQQPVPKLEIISDMRLPCKYVEGDLVYYGSFEKWDTPSARDQGHYDIFIPSYYEIKNDDQEKSLNPDFYPFGIQPISRQAEKLLPTGQSLVTIYTRVTAGEIFKEGETWNPRSAPPVIIEPA